MSVEDWARRKAENRYPTRLPYNARFERMIAVQEGFQDGAQRAFSALLSDETVTALAEHLYDNQTATTGRYRTSFFKDKWDDLARAALQVAVDAVTNPEPHDFGSTEEKNDD